MPKSNKSFTDASQLSTHYFSKPKFSKILTLLHDIHDRVQPVDAINQIKGLEEYKPFFIENPFSPENMEWFKQLRTSTFPILIS
jgi:L-alanine-DL-glutamate epimerase-like enolase superfamily enzyme